jgi:hypothetical protein
MKLLLLLLITTCSIHCFAQDIAAAPPPVNAHPFYTLAGNTTTAGRPHMQTTLGTVGTWTMLGGAVIVIGGIIEVKNGTKTDGPFTFVNQSQINAGHAVEIFGGGLFIAGLTMIIINSANQHHQGGKVSIVAPKNNEMGFAYNFK